jgi:two-component system, cell cycle response regulator
LNQPGQVISEERRRHGPPVDGQPLRVLVVDDDANYLAYLTALTRRVGFAVDTATDGDAALTILATDAYDAVVVDQQMPRMSGIDLIAHVRANARTRSVYAVMLTAHDDVETKLAALDAGFDDFVSKAASELEVVAKLAAARRVAARQRTMDVAIRELYGLATRDDLTGLFNRRFFIAEVERLLTAGTAISVILFDLDAFKQINDTHGHLAGDHVLRDVGALFQRNTRPEDIVCRFGGDEFVMAIPDLPLRDIERLTERLTLEVEELRWSVADAKFKVGVSTGIGSSRLLTQPTVAQLLNAADRDMYKNKWVRKRLDRRPAVAEDGGDAPQRGLA